jgi:hypothetical protein
MTTPNKNLISSKILDALPEMKVCRVERAGTDRLFSRPRLAKVYERWDYPDGKKGGVKTRWEDKFNAILPDDYFHWYKPKREQYVDVALKLLRSEIVKIDRRLALEGKKLEEEEKEKLAEKEGIMEDVHRVVGDEKTLLEVGEVIKMLEQEQAEKAAKGKIPAAQPIGMNSKVVVTA